MQDGAKTEPLYLYRFVYQSLFGQEYSDVPASDIEEAKSMFWAKRTPELYRLMMIKGLGSYEECGGGAYCSNEDSPSDRADAAEKHFAQQVLPGGRDIECGKVGDVCLRPAPVFGRSAFIGVRKRVKNLLALLVGKKDKPPPK